MSHNREPIYSGKVQFQHQQVIIELDRHGASLVSISAHIHRIKFSFQTLPDKACRRRIIFSNEYTHIVLLVQPINSYGSNVSVRANVHARRAQDSKWNYWGGSRTWRTCSATRREHVWYWTIIKRTFKSIFLPGAVILLLAALLLETGWVAISASGVNFFYYAVFIAAGLLAWRFHSTRVLFSVIVLLLGHHALEFLSQGRGTATTPGRIAFEAVAFLLPLNFILLTFFPERSAERRILGWFLVLLFFESVFVAAISRPDQFAPA